MRYDYECEGCKSFFEVSKPASQSGTEEFCSRCKHPAQRIYTSQTQKEFVPYYDEQAKCYITSLNKERRVMRKLGQIDARDYRSKWSPRVQEMVERKKWERNKGLI